MKDLKRAFEIALCKIFCSNNDTVILKIKEGDEIEEVFFGKEKNVDPFLNRNRGEYIIVNETRPYKAVSTAPFENGRALN